MTSECGVSAGSSGGVRLGDRRSTPNPKYQEEGERGGEEGAQGEAGGKEAVNEEAKKPQAPKGMEGWQRFGVTKLPGRGEALKGPKSGQGDERRATAAAATPGQRAAVSSVAADAPVAEAATSSCTAVKRRPKTARLSSSGCGAQGTTEVRR